MLNIKKHDQGFDLLTLQEASVYLKVSKSYLYKLTSSKKIPFYKPAGKLIYFIKSEIDEWLFEGKVLTVDELSDNFFKNLKRKKNGI